MQKDKLGSAPLWASNLYLTDPKSQEDFENMDPAIKKAAYHLLVQCSEETMRIMLHEIYGNELLQAIEKAKENALEEIRSCLRETQP